MHDTELINLIKQAPLEKEFQEALVRDIEQHGQDHPSVQQRLADVYTVLDALFEAYQTYRSEIQQADTVYAETLESLEQTLLRDLDRVSKGTQAQEEASSLANARNAIDAA